MVAGELPSKTVLFLFGFAANLHGGMFFCTNTKDNKCKQLCVRWRNLGLLEFLLDFCFSVWYDFFIDGLGLHEDVTIGAKMLWRRFFPGYLCFFVISFYVHPGFLESGYL